MRKVQRGMNKSIKEKNPLPSIASWTWDLSLELYDHMSTLQFVKLEQIPSILECLCGKPQIQGLDDFFKLIELICLGTITMCT